MTVVFVKIMISVPKFCRKLSILIPLLLLMGNAATKTNYASNKSIRKKVCIIPIGTIDKEILHYTQKELEDRFNVNIDIGRQLEDPAYAYHKQKKQYHSTKILKRIHKLGLTGYDRILGIADVDLYVPERTFVFGEAVIKKRVAVISLTRLRQKFYDLPEDFTLFRKRIIIEAVHELGHTYGLRHCTNNKCVMFLSKIVSDTDQKGAVLCSNCKTIMEDKKTITN
jgi:archaemetzincin